FREKPSILAGRHAMAVTPSACKQKLTGLLTRSSEVVVNGLSGLIRQLEFDRPSRLLLPYGGAIDRVAIWSNILDLQGDDVASAKLTVDGQVEHGQVTGSPLKQ